MKPFFFILVAAALAQTAIAQEKLSRADALKIACLVSLDLKQLQGTPIPTDVDVKRPAAVRSGEYGALVLPEVKLTKETLSRAGTEVVPIGQVWFHKLTLLRDGDAVPASQLRVVKVEADGRPVDAVQCALGVKKGGEGFDLLVYGKEKTALITVPLKKKEAQQEEPVALDAEHEGDGGRIIVRLLGQYEASFKVTELPE